VLNFGIATKPLWLIVIGLGYAALYYFLFRFVIRKWNLRTPGREEEEDQSSMVEADTSA
jgi:PTS system N-acetylglucosamine-specific IIC component